LENEIGDWTETIDYSDDNKEYVVLPTDIGINAVMTNDIQKVLNWLGPLSVDKQRINARIPSLMDFTLVHIAVVSKNSDLLSILLQLGANVDAVAATGWTPLLRVSLQSQPKYYDAQARLLLEWGAEISNCPTATKDEFIANALNQGNGKLANLLESEFGGRRCEIINMPNHPDLIGKTCVVEKYLPDKGRYKVIFETSKEAGLVGLDNLVRRDRTPNDCGYYITYKNGSTARHDFASTEECQAFVASLTDEEKSGDGYAVGEARAEQAAEALLAELTMDSSGGAKSEK
jgi:hypothetical protein